jgi:hypothetical protein
VEGGNVEFGGDLKVEGGNVEFGVDLTVNGVIKQTGAAWSRGGPGNWKATIESGQYISYGPLKAISEANCVYNSNGTITIQKAGLYLIAYCCLSAANNSTNFEIFINKNNSTILKGFALGTSHKSLSQTIIIFLNVNDTIGIYLNTGTTHNSVNYRNFSGYLIG